MNIFGYDGTNEYYKKPELILLKVGTLVKSINNKNGVGVVIDNWEDINEEFLNQKWKEMMERKYDMSKLTPEYWFKKILASL